MRICFFSDVHGNYYAFSNFLGEIEKLNLDRIIFGGDIFGYYYDAVRILRCLYERQDIECILGNHDKMVLDLYDGAVDIDYLISRYGNSYKDVLQYLSNDDIGFLQKAKPKIDIKADGLSLGFFHGGPLDYQCQRVYPDTNLDMGEINEQYDYIFCGHTHHKMIREYKSCYYINPGSLGQQRDGKGCSYMIFDTETRELNIKTVDYNIEALVSDINRNETDEKMKSKLIEVLYRKNRDE